MMRILMTVVATVFISSAANAAFTQTTTIFIPTTGDGMGLFVELKTNGQFRSLEVMGAAPALCEGVYSSSERELALTIGACGNMGLDNNNIIMSNRDEPDAGRVVVQKLKAQSANLFEIANISPLRQGSRGTRISIEMTVSGALVASRNGALYGTSGTLEQAITIIESNSR